MTLTYTVREVTSAHIAVDYSNNTYATIPLFPNDTKPTIVRRIMEFSSERGGYATADEVPFVVGETGTIQQKESFTYADLRLLDYPSVGDQLDALYWARSGDTSQLEAINAKIAEVKAMYPKDMPPLTREEMREILNGEEIN